MALPNSKDASYPYQTSFHQICFQRGNDLSQFLRPQSQMWLSSAYLSAGLINQGVANSWLWDLDPEQGEVLLAYPASCYASCKFL